MLILTRTPILIPGSPRTRVCFLAVDDHVWPAIENGDDPDKIPATENGGPTELIMTRMATSKRPALWVEGTELFVHAIGVNPRNTPGHAGRAHMLKGCPMPAMGVHVDEARGIQPDQAMARLLDVLGGFEEGKRVPFRCVELVERKKQ